MSAAHAFKLPSADHDYTVGIDLGEELKQQDFAISIEGAIADRTRVKVLTDRVAIRVTVEGERKEGSIFVPDTAKGHPNEGRVIAVGPGWLDKKGRFHATELQVGDYVVYGPFDGEEIDGVCYIREDKILYVLEGA